MTSSSLHSAFAASSVAVAALALASCSGSSDSNATSIDNCGDTVTFDHSPERVTLLKNAAVSTLDGLGVLDRVVAKAGVYPEDYYEADLNARLAEIPTLTGQLDAGGHLNISREVVVSTTPDLVIGETGSVNRDVLASSGIPVVEEPALCGALEGDATFNDVWDQVRMYGTIFERQDVAEQLVSELQIRVDDLTALDAGEGRSAAVLYPTIGGGVTYAYGTTSMSSPLLDAAGLTNVFDDVESRVFEVTAEEIIARNPDVIIALHSDGNPADIGKAVESLPGIGTVSAVRDGMVVPMLLNFVEPPTPLAVEGLGQLVSVLRESQ